MTGPEFDDIADLWQQEPDAAEQALMQELAAKVTRRARLAELSDLGLGVLLAAGILLLLFTSPAPVTIAAGAVIVGAGGWLAWKRYCLSEMAKMLDTSDRSTFLESAVRSARANLKRSRVGIWLVPPGAIIGVLFKYSYLSGGQVHALDDLLHERLPLVALMTLLLGFFFLALLRTHSRIKAELRNLRRLQHEYSEETDLEGEKESPPRNQAAPEK